MSSLVPSGDSRFKIHTYFSEETIEKISEREEIEAREKLSCFPFLGKENIGKSLSKYNGAIQIDAMQVDGLVKSPHKLLTIVSLLARESNVKPSYGLMVKKGSRKNYVHFMLELNETSSVGVFFFDSKRMLSVPQVHSVERVIKSAGLKGGIIVANNVGIPAKQEAKRINQDHGGYGIITIEHYDSMEKRFLDQ